MPGDATCKLETQAALASVEAAGKNFNHGWCWCPVKQRIEIDFLARLVAAGAVYITVELLYLLCVWLLGINFC